MPEMEKHVEIPEILREIPPERFRQVVETLMGVGYRSGHLSFERQIDEETRRPTGNSKVELLFTTKWLPSDQARTRKGTSWLYGIYVGTANNSTVVQDGRSVPARKVWEEALARSDAATHGASIHRTSTLRSADEAGSIVSRRLGAPVDESIQEYIREGA